MKQLFFGTSVLILGVFVRFPGVMYHVFCIFMVHRSCGRSFADALNDNYASLRAPSLMITGMTTGSWPYFSANAALAFSMNES